MIFRYVLAALLCLTVTPALAQKTKAELNSEIAASFPNNNSGTITPSVLRRVTGDMINSIMPTAPVVAGNLACFNGTTGLLKDCGTAPSPITIGPNTVLGSISGGAPVALSQAQLTSLTTSGVINSGNMACFNGATGLLRDCGIAPVNTTNATNLTSGTVAVARLPSTIILSSTLDNTTALQAAINSAVAAGTTLNLTGVGSFSTVTISGPLKMVGAGVFSTSLTSTATSGAAILIDTVAQVILEDFVLTQSGTPTQLVKIAPASGQTVYTHIKNVSFVNYAVAIDIIAANSYIVEESFFSSVAVNAIGIRVQNTFNADHGDGVIVKNTFTSNSPSTLTYGISYVSGGGLRVINNKFNGTFAPIALTLANAALTSVFFVSDNSIENFGSFAIQFLRAGTTGLFYLIKINSNEFAASAVASTIVSIPTDANGNWIKALSVNDNVVTMPSGGGQFANINSVDGFSISNNTIMANGGTAVKTVTGATASSGVVGPNAGTGTFAASTISSGSTTTIAPF